MMVESPSTERCAHEFARSLRADRLCVLCDPPPAPTEPPQPRRLTRADLHRLRVRAARRSLSEFVRYGWHVLEPDTPLEWNWHHEEVCAHVQGVLDGWLRKRQDPEHVQLVRNLAINVPPGSLKSRIIAVYAHAWQWVRCPSWKLICLSVNADAALRDARAAREVIRSDWYQGWFQPDWSLKDDQDALGNYGNTAEGFRLSRASGSEIVGLRGDAIFMDDPNNPKEAQSEKVRREVNGLWDTNTYTRVNDMRSSVRLIVQQRVHELDLTGHVLSKAPEDWCLLRLPAEYEVDRPCRTPFGGDRRSNPGESIHPARFTPDVLEGERRRGAYLYAGQYQQRPAPEGGGILRREWFKLIDPGDLPKPEQMVISVDCAAKKTEDGSYTAILVAARRGPNRYIMHVERGRWAISEMIARILKVREQFKQASRVLVEEKAAGMAVIETLQSKISGVIPIKVSAGDSKVSRAMAVQPECESLNVLIVKGGAWQEDFLHELCTFPNGANDDQVDVFTQALNYWRDPSRLWDAWKPRP